MQPIQDLELITSVDLAYKSLDERPVYHFVYASQLYGTLFAVYGSFSGQDNGSSFTVNSVTLRLINYKGVINIGFHGQPQFQKDNINFGVIALSNNEEVVVPILPAINVAKGGQVPLTFSRILHPLNAFSAHQTSPAGQLSSAPPTTPVFDSEFYERDGVDFFKSELREGMHGFPSQPSGQRMSIVGPRCRQGNVSLRF